MHLAEYVAQFLKMNGVRRIFGLPGGECVLLLEAFRKQGLDFILFHHETAAGFAAGVTGQLTGVPGVCLSTVGPGAVNLVASAAAATLERSPMLALTAEIETDTRDDVRHMKIDLTRLFDGVAKGSFILSPDSVGEDLSRAWNLALEPPAGAVHIAIAPDAASSPVSTSPGLSFSQIEGELDTASLELIRSKVVEAGRLMILAGIGIEAANAHSELIALAEAWQTPVAVTPKAKGHFPENHPLFSGCYSAYGDGPLVEALSKADLIVGAGLDSVDFVNSTWNIETPVINLNLAGADDETICPLAAFNGEIKGALRYLAAMRRPLSSNSEDGKEQASRIRRDINKELAFEKLSAGNETVGVEELIRGLRRAVPDDGVVTVDVGVFKLVLLQLWHTDTPKSLLVANGLSAMGYALPGAVAAALEEPARKVVAVVGDGALLMYAGELATVARERLPIIILVIVDEALSLIRLKQLRLDVPVHGTEFQRVHFAALAESFELEYRLLDGVRPSADVFAEALDLNRPVLVEARIDKLEYDQFR